LILLEIPFIFGNSFFEFLYLYCKGLFFKIGPGFFFFQFEHTVLTLFFGESEFFLFLLEFGFHGLFLFFIEHEGVIGMDFRGTFKGVKLFGETVFGLLELVEFTLLEDVCLGVVMRG
jgi:hypothetical protein